MRNKILPWAVGAILLSSSAHAAFSFSQGKSSFKQDSKWSMADLFAQKKKVRAMDLWLGFHKPSPHEVFFGGAYLAGETTNQHSWLAHFAAFTYMVGAQYQRDWMGDEAKNIGMFHLRLFGLAQQATHLTVEGGMKQEVRNGVTFYNPLAGVEATIYFNSFIGIEGHYRYYFPTDVADLGGKISGNRYEAFAFVEFAVLRVYGGYAYETEFNTSTSSTTRNGMMGGLRLYF